MSFEVPVKSFYLNGPTGPTISRKKAQKLDLKKWETSLGDLRENKKPLSFPSFESNASCSYKEQNMCKKKINEVPKKLFFENAHKCLKRKPISEGNIRNNLLCFNSSFSSDKSVKRANATFQKNAFNIKWSAKPKLEHMPCVFSKNTFKSLKRKSVFGKSTDVDFSSLEEQTNHHSSFVGFSLKEKRISPLQNANFNICNIKGVFEKTLDPRCTDVLLQNSNPKQYTNSMLENVRNIKMPSLTPNSIIPEKLSHNDVQVLSKNASFLNIPLTAKCFKKVKLAAEINFPEHIKHLSNSDQISALSTKCSSVGVGSEWVHSLEQIHENHSQYEEKKKIHNLLVGGFCERILKIQRQELLEKAICEHKNGLKTKTESDLLMRINSIILDYEIIVAECCLLKKNSCPEELTKSVSGPSFALSYGLTYIALFQKSSFCKQHIKTGKYFLISLPWHLIQLKSFKFPVIIFKYFKSASMEQIQQKHLINENVKKNAIEFQDYKPDGYQNKTSKLSNAKQKEDLFSMWKKRLSICARIQRIWNQSISCKKSLKLSNNQHITRLTLLLQTRNGDFYLLTTLSHHYLYMDWFKFVQSNEGDFYFFESLNVSDRLSPKRYPNFFKYLKNLLKENKVTEMKQSFVYQLGVDGMTKKPSKLIGADFPPFLSVNFQSLSTVLKNLDGRASFKTKVLLQYGSILYISDESIFHLGTMKLAKMFLPAPTLFSKSGVWVTEALVFGGNLYLDEYSQISLCDHQCTFTIKDVELSLRPDLNVNDIVTVKGNITSVNENNACVWLQCNFCRTENLVQNSEEVIICEDCCLVIEQPLLKVKLTVTVVNGSLQNILLNIELLSHTIKRILSLKENSYQPQCNVSDVLGKEIGPLLCYVRGVNILESHTICYLNEVEDYH